VPKPDVDSLVVEFREMEGLDGAGTKEDEDEKELPLVLGSGVDLRTGLTGGSVEDEKGDGGGSPDSPGVP